MARRSNGPPDSLTFVAVFGTFRTYRRDFSPNAWSGAMEQYIPIAIMILIGVVAGVVFANINRFLGPHKPTEEKLSTYESGMEPVRTARERFSVKFYLVA